MIQVCLKMKFRRIYHPYQKWEEVSHNMWGTVKDRKLFLSKAIEFTGDSKKYGSYMVRVINEWPVSCENALTDYSLNRRAWIGHAAAALAMKCPEDIVRLAWSYLTDEQKYLANEEARKAICAWENNRVESGILCEDMGEPMLF